METGRAVEAPHNDPHTGAPAETDVMTATVVAPTACLAEVGAKMAFLLGGGAGLEWIEARPSLAALMVLENGQVLRSSRLADLVWINRNGIGRPGADGNAIRETTGAGACACSGRTTGKCQARMWGALIAAFVGMVLALVMIPVWVPTLGASIMGADPKFYWYLSRASAMVAYGLLWVSMASGLITNKMARIWPGAFTAFDLHQFTSLLGLGFAAFHALILLGNAVCAVQPGADGPVAIRE